MPFNAAAAPITSYTGRVLVDLYTEAADSAEANIWLMDSHLACELRIILVGRFQSEWASIPRGSIVFVSGLYLLGGRVEAVPTQPSRVLDRIHTLSSEVALKSADLGRYIRLLGQKNYRGAGHAIACAYLSEMLQRSDLEESDATNSPESNGGAERKQRRKDPNKREQHDVVGSSLALDRMVRRENRCVSEELFGITPSKDAAGVPTGTRGPPSPLQAESVRQIFRGGDGSPKKRRRVVAPPPALTEEALQRHDEVGRGLTVFCEEQDASEEMAEWRLRQWRLQNE